MREAIQTIRSKTRLQVIVPFLIFMAGAILGPILEVQISSPLDVRIIYIAVVILFLTIVFLWDDARSQITNIQENTKTLAKAVGQSAQILPYEEGYKRLREQIKHSEQEVRIFSKYVFDWENQKPIYDPKRLQNPDRKTAYGEVISLLKHKESDNNFKYVRIVEVPSDHSIAEVFPFDHVYAEQCKKLAKYSRQNPEFASLRMINSDFPNTFSIWDRRFLYMEFELLDPSTGEYVAPFVMIVDDPNSEFMVSLVKLHERLEANSTLITHFDD